MKDIEKKNLNNTKPIHKDFGRVVVLFLEKATTIPIALEGSKIDLLNIVEHLSEVMGYNPNEYDLDNMTMNGKYYGMGLLNLLNGEITKDKFVVVKNINEESYDELELSSFVRNYYGWATNIRNPEFRMLILRDTNNKINYSPLYNQCLVVEVPHDSLLEKSSPIAEKNIQKVKKVKDVK